MAAFLVYLTATGEIVRNGYCEDGAEGMQASEPGEVGITNLVGATYDTHYVEMNGTVTPKPEMGADIDMLYIAAGNTQVATISDIPAGARLFIDGEDQGTVSDGEVQFSANDVDTYDLLLTHYRHLPQTFHIGVGIAEFDAAIETEIAVAVAVDLPAAIETEVPPDAVLNREAFLPVATETETAPSVVLAIDVNVPAAVEREQAPDIDAGMPAAVETETVPDAVQDREAELEPVVEAETALDAAA